MQRILLAIAGTLTLSHAQAQASGCSPSGNVVLFTNYDGGVLNIQVDEDIPDLRIGVVAYNAVRIAFTGAFASNVTEVRYAGINADAGNYCGDGPVNTTSVTGVAPGIVQVLVAPAGVTTSPFGYPNIICGYSCVVTEWQGGCNTVDEIEAYFADAFNGSLRAHVIQYGCWEGSYRISEQLSCCGPSAGVGGAGGAVATLQATPTPATDVLRVAASGPFVIGDAMGRIVHRSTAVANTITMVDVSAWPGGSYWVRAEGEVVRVVVQR